jgi:UDP-N-acetylenolpyruvoylglucosamine reductase
VAAEAAVPVERSCDSSAAATLVELETTVGAPGLVGAVEHHGRLIAARTKAGRYKG